MTSPIPHQNMEQSGGCFQKCLHPNYDGAASSSSMSLNHNNMRYNDTQQEMKSTEDFLASELNKLSVEERSKALEDLHCVGEDLTETSELIETSLQEMDRILKERNDPTYNTAASQNQSYVEDPTFRLRFLRANNHDARRSANQMLGLLSCKEKYFGRDKLARDITLDDLNEEDMDLLLSGLIHIQDGTDRNGRLVVYILRFAIHEVKAEVMIRLFHFVYFSMLCPLECVQRKGIVVCGYDMRPGNLSPVLTKMGDYLKFLDSLANIPIRRSALHVCLKEIPGSLVSYNIILGRVLQSFQRSEVARVRMHYGSDIELQYKLRSHGFHPKTIPVDINGNIRRDIQNVWFQKYVTNEWGRIFAYANHMPLSAEMHHSSVATAGEENEHGSATWNPPDGNNTNDGQQQVASADAAGHRKSPSVTGEILIDPTPTDVLLGRGKGAFMHPGNVRFRAFLIEYQEEYNNTPRYKRVKTHTELTRILLKDHGVRFLKKTESGDGWVGSDFSEAEKKVKQFFRSEKKKTTS